jgi:hypothetical protein
MTASRPRSGHRRANAQGAKRGGREGPDGGRPGFLENPGPFPARHSAQQAMDRGGGRERHRVEFSPAQSGPKIGRGRKKARSVHGPKKRPGAGLREKVDQ